MNSLVMTARGRPLEHGCDTTEDEEREQNEETPARKAEPSVPGSELAAGRVGWVAGRLEAWREP